VDFADNISGPGIIEYSMPGNISNMVENPNDSQQQNSWQVGKATIMMKRATKKILGMNILRVTLLWKYGSYG
jgi:hypothetical protein